MAEVWDVVPPPTQLDRIEQMLIDLLRAKKKPKARASKKHEYSEKFEAIWKDYPKVSGANKQKAYAAYIQRQNESETPLQLVVNIHMAVIQYAKFCEATDRYVMLPATFFGHSMPYLDDYTIPTAPDNVPRDNTELVSWAKDKGYRGAYPNESYPDYRKALEVLHRKENRNVQK